MGHWGGVCEVLLVDFLLYTRSSFLLFGRFPRWIRFGSIFRRIFGRALEYGNVILLTHIFFFHFHQSPHQIRLKTGLLFRIFVPHGYSQRCSKVCVVQVRVCLVSTAGRAVGSTAVRRA